MEHQNSDGASSNALEFWHQYRLYAIALIIAGAILYSKWTRSEVPQNLIPRIGEKVVPVDVQEESNPEKEVRTVPLAVDFTTTTRQPKRFTRNAKKTRTNSQLPSVDSEMVIFYSTLTGSSQRYAEHVHNAASSFMTVKPQLINLDYVEDLDAYFVAPKDHRTKIYLLVVPSYETESPLDYFLELLKDTYNDFRIDSKPLQVLAGFSVFGLGDQEGWPEVEGKFCYQARLVDKYLGKLGAKRIFPLGMGCVKSDANHESLDEWLQHLEVSLRDPSLPEEVNIVDSDDDEEETEEKKEDVIDVEDMGKVIKRTKDQYKQESTKQMVAQNSPTYNSLTKQGYTVVGSHSGVKICRWTKSALRGRGSCYKYSFYGIKSHLCMETTPSLSCSNKCVFCWRHGTNPVGTTWRWQVDQPEDILTGALEGHYKKIKQLKGVPGVVSSRFAEAFTVRHCALSLVGEPIFYPHINRFVDLLHKKHISSFLVCNAQHPAELKALKRVTQLYVSIDASNKESLKKVDRPLHRDFWERMMQCLDILREDQAHQRTVFRLTLVKDFNIDEHEGYAELVKRGLPSFVEVKGVTYCGTSKSNPLTMQNVPFYQEVKTFVEKLNKSLADRGLEYGIAAEHEHSCCILLAQKRFMVDGVWHTTIDYSKFFNLLESGEQFTPIDYIAPTPTFALYGNGGFNPEDTRHKRK